MQPAVKAAPARNRQSIHQPRIARALSREDRMRAESIDAAGIAVGKTMAYGGGASALIFGLSAEQFAALVGAAVAVIGLAVQIIYNRRRDAYLRRQDERNALEHQAKMEALRNGKRD